MLDFLCEKDICSFWPPHGLIHLILKHGLDQLHLTFVDMTGYRPYLYGKMFKLWVKERTGQPTTKLLLTVAQSKGKRLTNNSLTKDNILLYHETSS